MKRQITQGFISLFLKCWWERKNSCGETLESRKNCLCVLKMSWPQKETWICIRLQKRFCLCLHRRKKAVDTIKVDKDWIWIGEVSWIRRSDSSVHQKLRHSVQTNLKKTNKHLSFDQAWKKIKLKNNIFD